jgi:serine/threonine-protein kinase
VGRLLPLLTPRVLWLLAGASVVGLGAGYLVATRVVFPAPPPPGDLTAVPDLRGMVLQAAAGRLVEAGLELGAVDSLRHPSAVPGTVLGQSPLPGQLSLMGDSVRVSLSSGPERRAVPDVTRLRADRARTVLESAGFVVEVDSLESDLPAGAVISTEPGPGAEAAIPLRVRLTLSLGPPMVEVPLLLGLPQAEAIALLEEVGLVAGAVETRFRFGRDQGLVVEQEPPAATLVQKGTAVRLVVGGRGGRPRNKDPRRP